MRNLNLDKLEEGLPGINKVTGSFLLESLVVALLKSGHQSGVILHLDGEVKEDIRLI